MISKFSLLFGKPKKPLCGVFFGRSISEFKTSCNLDQRGFVWLQELILKMFRIKKKKGWGEQTILKLDILHSNIRRSSKFYTKNM